MADNNFIRFFMILSENEKGFGMSGTPSGYCKVESLNGKANFTFSIKNIKSGEYNIYVLTKNNDIPVFIGEIVPRQDGSTYKSFQTNANNIFESKMDISTVEAVHILSDNNSVLSGYVNRNITKSVRQAIDIKLNNIVSDEEKEFEAASVNISDANFTEELPDEIETEITPIEIESTDSCENTFKNANESIESSDDEKQNTNSNNGFSSYVETLAKLYEGLVGGKKTNDNVCDTKPKENTAEECSDYYSLIEGYYRELFDNGVRVDPFCFSNQNSKWIHINPYDAMCGMIRLVGLIYEAGNIKYIADGMPVYAGNGFCPNVSANMIWLPAKQNCCGIIGYWVQFIDAQTGKITMPDIKIL